MHPDFKANTVSFCDMAMLQYCVIFDSKIVLTRVV